MTSKVYRWCGVPQCTNTSIKTPNKLFVFVPFMKRIRVKWLKLARRDLSGLNPRTTVYFCEDHFDLPNDMENYMQYHLMGSVSQVRMKLGCVPTKFECQSNGMRRKRSSKSKTAQQRNKQRTEREVEGTTAVASKQLDLEDASSANLEYMQEKMETDPTEDLCRCCHSKGSFKSLNSCVRANEETFAALLLGTFNINIPPISNTSLFCICEDCIHKLHDAATFKQLVWDCEEQFHKTLNSQGGKPLSIDDIKTKTIDKHDVDNDINHDEGPDNEDSVTIKLEAEDEFEETVEEYAIDIVKSEDLDQEYVLPESNEKNLFSVVDIKTEVIDGVDVDNDVNHDEAPDTEDFVPTKLELEEGSDTDSEYESDAPGPSSNKKLRMETVHSKCETTYTRLDVELSESRSTDDESRRLNKAPKTSAERSREFRARQALLKQQSKKQQESHEIEDISTEDIQRAIAAKIEEKRAKSAEATRRWRERRKGVSESSKKQAKTAAQRMREYRERKKTSVL